MKKFTLLLGFIVCTLWSSAQTMVLSDNFDNLTAGTFGNSGSQVMTNTTGLLPTDTRTGWDLAGSSKVYSGAGTLKIGTSSALGYIKTTPLNLAGTFTLNFSAYAWSGDATTICIKLNEDTIQTITLSNLTISSASSLENFTVQGKGTGTDIITFTAKQASKNRFLLDNVVITSASGNAVALPTFGIEGGVYTTPQTVSISSTTPGATIYYTTDGSIPTTSSTVYSTPILVSSTTTLKAFATATGMDNSGIATATYNFPTSISTLAELQTKMPVSGTTSEYFQYTGSALVTCVFTSSEKQSIFLQDATGGYMIYDNGKKLTTTYNVGDKVTGMIGQIQNYGSAPEFIPTGNFTVSSTGNAVTPTPTTLANVGNYLFMLVSIPNVKFTVADGTAAFAASTNYDITDASGSSVFRLQSSVLDYVGKIIPATTNLTAIVSKYNTSYQIFARQTNDISALASGVHQVSEGILYITLVGKKLTVPNATNSKAEIFNMLGAKVQDIELTNGSAELNLNKGLYIVRVGNKSAKISL